MTEYFLGVDGGQSSTTAIIGDGSGKIVGLGRGGPCNHVNTPEDRAKFVSAIQSTVGEACAQAGVDGRRIRYASACLGLSGGAENKESILREILASDRMLITDDARIALAGATAGGPGVVVIAGTGSIALGRNANGRIARAGGWGYLFGDEGGGFWMARQALRSALQFEEGWGEPSSLRARLLDATGTRSINDLMHRCYTSEFPRPRVAQLSILVNHAAEEGDGAALEILDSAASELAAFAMGVRRQLFGEGEPAVLSYAGGVFRSRIVLGQFRKRMVSEGVQLKPPVYPAVLGALREAYRSAGRTLVLDWGIAGHA